MTLARLCACLLALAAIESTATARAAPAQSAPSERWIGGLDDSGKRILSAALTRSKNALVLTIWQKTGDPYVMHFRGRLARSSPASLLDDRQNSLLATLSPGTIEGKVAIPSLNIAGRLVLARRQASSKAPAYDGIWKAGFLGPESFQMLAADAARRKDVAAALSWLQRGREAKRPLDDALAFTDPALDGVRKDERFARIIKDPVSAYPELSQQRFRIRVDRGVWIPMRDGTKLLADIYRPDIAGRFPVILIRTPYGRGPDIPPGGVDHFAPRGYVVVIQSPRGRDGSQGEFQPWLNERRDGYDSIDWVSRQPWSDGNVGMMGLSYLGHVQWQAAVEAHPALKAILPEVAGTDSFLDTPYDHGILRLEMIDWARGMIPPARQRTLPKPKDEALVNLPLSGLDKAYAGETMPIWQQLLDLDTSDKWASANFLADMRNVRIPALGISGWWDTEANSTMRNFRTMRDLGRTNQWVIYGPWQHVWNETSKFKDQDYGPSSIIDFKSLAVRWFDQWLKRKPVNVEAIPKAQIFVTGANRWESFPDWPPPGAGQFDLNLSNGANCTGPLPALVRESGEGCGPAVYDYDPAKVSVAGPQFWRDDTTALKFDSAKGDYLLYESAPFDRPTTLVSPGELDLSFSTTGRDVDFFVVIFDRDQAGVARALSGPGKMRMSFRNSWSHPSFLEPGAIYRGKVELRPFAHQFKPGHRLGVMIRSEWFPGYARNLNTSEPIKDAVRMEPARISIYGDKDRASRLRLWNIPEKTD